MNGAIKWFAGNSVAANLLMILVMVAGTVSLLGMKQEVFPEMSLDLITVRVPYLGAAPEEVEEAVCIRIEEAIEGIDGIKQITSTADENLGSVVIKLELGAEVSRVLDEVKARVDAIDTFPAETERPIITELTNRRQVIDLMVWGDVDRKTLKVVAERMRDDLSSLPEISLVEMANVPPYEISIEVSESMLRRHGLSFDQVANAVRRASLDLPGGSIKTEGGEILLRTKGQAEVASEFERLAVLSRPDGSDIHLGEIATVIDGFADTDQFTRFDGRPAMGIQVFRTGEQAALDIVAAVNEYVDGARPGLPAGIHLDSWQDQSKVLRDRLDLLIRNGIAGLILVFVSLALFLRFRLAFWVSLGIPISFFGALWMMPMLGVSINLISLFAFIVVLGIVVDDAIVAGENIYTYQQRTGEGMRGAVEGAQEVSTPVIFAVLTTIAAFFPMLGVPGMMGKIMRVIPLVVISCLVFSLLESLLVLPAHLRHMRAIRPADREGWWGRFQSFFSEGLMWFVRRVYSPALHLGLRYRYATVALAAATLILTGSFVGAGWIKFRFFPDVEADYMAVSLTMPQGTPVETTSEALQRLEESVAWVRREAIESSGEDPYQHVVTAIGSQPWSAAQRRNAGTASGVDSASHLGEVVVELVPSERRSISGVEMVSLWRDYTPAIPDALEMSFSSSIFSAGEDINVQLTGPGVDRLRRAADRVKEQLSMYPNVREIADSFREGKRQVELDIKPEAEMLGLNLSDLARQVRQAFYGEEAQRIVRGREDLRVMVRYPKEERRSLGNLEGLRIRTADGAEVPFGEVASVVYGRGLASIQRVDRRRTVNVTADVDAREGATTNEILADLQARVLPEVLADFPDVAYSFEGQSTEQRDTMGGLLRGFAIAIVVIFTLLAIPLRSYVQPLIIMTAIPFGLVGAVWGHVFMGLDITIMTMFGVVALTGVVVNDSLVMVDFINRYRLTHDSVLEAVRQAGAQRFRPIFLTSLTTFAGLTPLMLERSMQARFLIPMAVSLAFGVAFSTVISLMIVPCSYIIMTDARRALRRVFRLDRSQEQPMDVVTPASGAADA